MFNIMKNASKEKVEQPEEPLGEHPTLQKTEEAEELQQPEEPTIEASVSRKAEAVKEGQQPNEPTIKAPASQTESVEAEKKQQPMKSAGDASTSQEISVAEEETVKKKAKQPKAPSGKASTTQETKAVEKGTDKAKVKQPEPAEPASGALISQPTMAADEKKGITKEHGALEGPSKDSNNGEGPSRKPIKGSAAGNTDNDVSWDGKVVINVDGVDLSLVEWTYLLRLTDRYDDQKWQSLSSRYDQKVGVYMDAKEMKRKLGHLKGPPADNGGSK